ncbi:IS1595 family transposase, partial [Halobacteriales archaeon QS_8_69_26]
SDHRTVLHEEEYVSADGVHTNQVECLWSIVQPWLRKFRGLSKQGLEQAARTFGFLRSLNLAGAPVQWLVDTIAINVFSLE